MTIRCLIFFISKHVKHNDRDKAIYFTIEGLKIQTNNETFDAELELENLSENGTRDA